MADPVTGFLATVGGGSVATGTIIVSSAALATASGIQSARATRKAGKVAEAQSKIDAAAEGDAARQREIDRKQKLLRAISTQVAQAGAAGVRFEEGSPAAIARLDIEEANRDLRIDRANTRQRERGLIAQGRAARSAANAEANKTLLDTAGRVGGLFA